MIDRTVLSQESASVKRVCCCGRAGKRSCFGSVRVHRSYLLRYRSRLRALACVGAAAAAVAVAAGAGTDVGVDDLEEREFAAAAAAKGGVVPRGCDSCARARSG